MAKGRSGGGGRVSPLKTRKHWLGFLGPPPHPWISPPTLRGVLGWEAQGISHPQPLALTRGPVPLQAWF